MRLVIIALAAGLLGGCVFMGQSYGSPITQEQVSAIKAGETTKEQVIAVFGQPFSNTADSDGKQILIWAYTEISPMMAGMTQKSLAVYIDASGKVERYQVGSINGLPPANQ